MNDFKITTGTDLEQIFFPVAQLSTNEFFGKDFNFSDAYQSVVVLPGQNNQIINLAGHKYDLIENEEFFLPMYEDLSAMFGQSNIGVKVINEKNRRFYVSFTLKNAGTIIKHNDTVAPVVRMVNSYDKSAKQRVSVSFYRMICSNGLMGFQTESITISHTKGNRKLQFADIQEKLIKGTGFTEKFKELSERVVTPLELERIIEAVKEGNTRFPKKQRNLVPGIISEELALMGQGQMTAFDVYNGFNNVLNHHNPNSPMEVKEIADKRVLKLIEKELSLN